MKEVKDKAREMMKGFCRVCKVCDGRLVLVKFLAWEVSVQERPSRTMFRHWRISGSTCVCCMVSLTPDTTCSVLGYDLDMPVIAAPIGGVSFNMGGAISEEAYADAVVGGSRAAGLIAGVGDGVPPFIHEAGFAAVEENAGHGIPFIKPWEGDEIDEKFEKARATGCSVYGMDVDAAGLITLRQMGRPVAPKTPAQLKEIVDRIHGWVRNSFSRES